jgi:hypothetical protein
MPPRKRNEDADLERCQRNLPVSVILKAAREICFRTARGETLTTICDHTLNPHLPDVNTVLNWLEPPAEYAENSDVLQFQADYARAQRQCLILELDKMTALCLAAKGKDEAANAKNACDVIRWRLERLLPKKYAPTQRIVKKDEEDVGNDKSFTDKLQSALETIAERRALTLKDNEIKAIEQ